MTIFENKTIVARSQSAIFAFLSDLNNHEVLMPENVYNWSSTADEAHLTIKNMAKLSLKVESRLNEEQIVIAPTNEVPFAIKMTWNIVAIDQSNVSVNLSIEAQLNMMMKVMASGPLQKLVDHQVEKLKEAVS